jgi:hypothetical protein
MNPVTNSPSSIPVLTEVISLDPSPEPVQLVIAPTEAQPSWEQLEKSLHEKVLHQLLTRVDFVLEHRIKEDVADILQNAVDELAQDIRHGLAKSLEDVIQRTISQELAKVQGGNELTKLTKRHCLAELSHNVC